MISPEGENLVFLLSLPRSGSTVVSLVLGNHTMIVCPPEPWFLLRLADLVQPSFSDSIYDCEANRMAAASFLAGDLLRDAVRAFACEAYNSHILQYNKAIFVDKTPRYYYILPFLDTVFPKARKIWLKRNPLDVAASYKKTWRIDVDILCGQKFTPHTFDMTTGLFNLSKYFSEPSPYKLEIDYETFVTSPNLTIEAVCGFLGVPYEEQMLDYGRNGELLSQHRRSRLGDKNLFAFSSLQPQSIGRWVLELSLAEAQKLVDIIGMEVFCRMGYEDTAVQLRELGIKQPDENQAASARNLMSAHLKGTAYEHNEQLRQIFDFLKRIDESRQLNQTLKDLKAESLRLKSNLDRITKENERLHFEKQTSAQQSTRLENEKKGLLHQIDMLKMNNADYGQRIGQLETEKRNLLQNLTVSRRNIEDLEQEISTIKSDFAENERLSEILRGTLHQERMELNGNLLKRLLRAI